MDAVIRHFSSRIKVFHLPSFSLTRPLGYTYRYYFSVLMPVRESPDSFQQEILPAEIVPDLWCCFSKRLFLFAVVQNKDQIKGVLGCFC